MESFSGLLRAVMNHTDTCILVCDAETQEILYSTSVRSGVDSDLRIKSGPVKNMI